MAIHSVRPDVSSECRNPFDCDELIVKALGTVSAFVALADGSVDAIERDEAVNYIDRQRLAPSVSRERVGEYFDARARDLEGRDFADLIAEALRPVAALSLTCDVLRIAERVAAADGRIDANEAQVVGLIRLIITPPAKIKAIASSKFS